MRHLFFLLIFIASAVAAQTPWQRTYGGYGIDAAHDVIPVDDAGYLVLGSTGSFGEGGDGYYFKISPLGDLEWSKYYGASGVDQLHAIENVDDGYIMVGSSSSNQSQGYNGWLIMTSTIGDVIWEKDYGGSDWDFLYDVCIINDGFILVGTSYSSSPTGDIWIVKTDFLGEAIWSEYYDSGGKDEGRGVAGTMDGSFVVAGSIQMDSDEQDAILIKFNATGGVEWDTVLGGESIDEGYSVTKTLDGGFVLGGSSKSFTPYNSMYMAKVEENGDFIWHINTIGGGGEWSGRRIVELANGDLILAGYTEAFGAGSRDMYMWHTDGNGNYIEGPTFGGLEQDEASGVCPTDDGGYILVGMTNSYGPGAQAAYVVRHYGSPIIPDVVEVFDPVSIHEESTSVSLSIHPNPITPGAALSFTIPQTATISSITLTDLSGRIIDQKNCNICRTYQIPQIASGMYHLIFNLQDGGRSDQSIVVD